MPYAFFRFLSRPRRPLCRVVDAFLGWGQPVSSLESSRRGEVENVLPRSVYLGSVELTTGTCAFSASTDGGATWEELDTPDLLPYTDCGFGAADPKNIRTELKQGPDGTLCFRLHAQDPKAGGTISVLLGRSSDEGMTWETSVVHARGPARGGTDI